MRARILRTLGIRGFRAPKLRVVADLRSGRAVVRHHLSIPSLTATLLKRGRMAEAVGYCNKKRVTVTA